MAKRTSSYTQAATSGGETRFEVVPAQAVLPWFFLVVYAFFGLAALFLFVGSGQPAILVVTALTALGIWRLVTKANRGREPSSFVVTPGGIAVGSTTVDRSSLTCIRIDNDVSHEQTQVPVSNDPTVVVAGVVPGAVMVHHGNPTRQAAQQAMAGYKKLEQAVSWRVDAEASGKATCLARGLDAVTARGLASDVVKRLGG